MDFFSYLEGKLNKKRGKLRGRRFWEESVCLVFFDVILDGCGFRLFFVMVSYVVFLSYCFFLEGGFEIDRE